MPPGTRQIEMRWRCSSCSHDNLGRHAVCQQCGNPKDASERYVMPGDTAAAPSVTDPDLLRMATAGPNWRCSYCGSDQRKLDGNCAQCGAAPVAEKPRPPEKRERWPWWRVWLAKTRAWIREHPFATGAIGLVLAIILVWAWVNRTRHFDATVAAVRWEQNVVVERWQIWQREGWRQDLAPSAFDVVSLGSRVHHYEQVLDGYDTQYYTEKVACGEDCRDVPERCSESCSDNGNGFATCRTTCSGGGRSCSTRYCDERRSRQVPRYRQEPRYAEMTRYRIWDWGYHRTASASGATTNDLYWPDEAARVGVGLPPDEKERSHRVSKYRVTLGYDEDETIEVEVDATMFATMALGSPHRLTLAGDDVAVDGAPVPRVDAR
jgi:hypothetical protein